MNQQEPELKKNETASGEHYSSLKEAFDAKIIQPWVSVPKWFFFVVWIGLYALLRLPLGFLANQLAEGSSAISELPWNDILIVADLSIFLFTFYVAPPIYRRLLKKL